MHKRRKRELTGLEQMHEEHHHPTGPPKGGQYFFHPMHPEEWEEHKRKRAQWDIDHPDGEGPSEAGGQWRWVRVADHRGRGMVTFMLHVKEEQVDEMFISVQHKGLPANPYVLNPLSELRWRAAEVEHYRQHPEERYNVNPHNPEDARYFDKRFGRVNHLLGSVDYDRSLSGVWDTEISPGQRPVRNVQPEIGTDGDMRFIFWEASDSFKVRGSKLAPALLAVRQAGEQKISLHTLRQVIARM